MESIGDARAFLSAAREVALHQADHRHQGGAHRARRRRRRPRTPARSTGSDEVLDAAFRRVRRAARRHASPTCSTWPRSLAKQPRPRGPRLTIVTNAGGPGVLATDALHRAAAASWPPLAPRRMRRARRGPAAALEPRQPDRHPRRRRRPSGTRKALEIAAEDPSSDGLLVDPHAAGDDRPDRGPPRRSSPTRRSTGKPVLASWMGGADVAAGEAILNRAGIPTFAYPDTAARVFNYMWRYTRQPARALRDAGAARRRRATTRPRRAPADAIVAARAARGPDAAHRVRVEAAARRLRHPDRADTRVARDRGRGGRGGRRDRLPGRAQAALARRSPTRPTSAACSSNLRRRRRGARGVRGDRAGGRREGRARSTSRASPCSRWSSATGYELIVGSSVDPQFGPVLLFGAGGQLVEVFRDRALGLPPLTTHAGAPDDGADPDLHGAAGRARPAARSTSTALEQLLVRFSQLVVEQPWIEEIDINPLLASPERLIALDARVVLHAPRRRRRPTCRARPSGRTRRSTSDRGSAKDGDAGHHPSDPPRGRAADGRLPRDAVRAQRLPALPRTDEARASASPTSG